MICLHLINKKSPKTRLFSAYNRIVLHNAGPQRTHDAKITSLWRQNDIASSFCRHNYVLFRRVPVGLTVLHAVLALTITMTSLWARWRLKSSASRLFTQQFIRAQIKENIKVPRHWPLCGELTGDRWIPAQMASNAKNVFFWWRHHDSLFPCRSCMFAEPKFGQHRACRCPSI